MKAILELLARHRSLRELVVGTLIGLGVYAVCALIIVAAELRTKRDMRIYRTRNALNDLAYGVFYKCSIYNFLVFPLFAFLSPRLQFLQLHAMRKVPESVAIVACWILFDFFNYWTHRLQHAVRPLWAFHSVHHTQTQLTFLTANRIHAVEQLYVGMLMIIPAFILGVPQPRWLPLLLVQTFSETMQHAQLDWTFRPLRWLFISPVTHAVHHSADEREYNANYGRVLSLWDVVFGTFVFPSERTRRYGVDGMNVPETLMGQFVHPFRYLAHDAKARTTPRRPLPAGRHITR